MSDESTGRCDNLACVCEAPAGTTTCSAYCDSPAGRDVQEIVCGCGHDKCATANSQQLAGDAGSES